MSAASIFHGENMIDIQISKISIEIQVETMCPHVAPSLCIAPVTMTLLRNVIFIPPSPPLTPVTTQHFHHSRAGNQISQLLLLKVPNRAFTLKNLDR